jgi:AraC-like DNA-binding protein
MSITDRVEARRRAVVLARNYREQEGLTIAEIARRLGRSPGTVRGYFYDPTGEKARRVKVRYCGVCRGCGAPTAVRRGKGDTYEYCQRCRPGRPREWTHERVRDATRVPGVGFSKSPPGRVEFPVY